MQRLNKRTRLGLALLALIVFGVTCWQVSNWPGSTVHASAATRALRVALDDAAAQFMADPTPETANLLNDARVAFLKAAAADPSYNAANPNPKIGLSAMVQIQALRHMKRNLTKTQKKIGSRL